MLGMDKGSTEERLILWNLFPPRVRVRPSREWVYLDAHVLGALHASAEPACKLSSARS